MERAKSRTLQWIKADPDVSAMDEARPEASDILFELWQNKRLVSPYLSKPD